MAPRAEPGQERPLSGFDERDRETLEDASPQGTPSADGDGALPRVPAPPVPEGDDSGWPTMPGELPHDPEDLAPDGVDSGWPTTPGGLPPAPYGYPPIGRDAPAAAEQAHEHHSRNPVDRLTRRLPDPIRVVVDWVVTIVAAVAIVLLVKAYVVNPYKIPSSSMEPTLHCAQPKPDCEARFDDRVLANRFIYHFRDPRRGDIIVFHTPAAAEVACGEGGTFVKRLIGLPGDTVEVRLVDGRGYVFVNGKKLDEPYIEPDRRSTEQYGPITVPQDNYFMMGDNRSQSCDSRKWGTVTRSELIGKVFATYWPPNRISLH